MKRLAIKITNKYESEAVQKALFDMGFKWRCENSKLLSNFNDREEHKYILTPYLKDVVTKLPKTIGSHRISKIPLSDTISSSEFFEKYVGHIELFPDYEKPEMSEENKVWSDDAIYDMSQTKVTYNSLRGNTKIDPLLTEIDQACHNNNLNRSAQDKLIEMAGVAKEYMMITNLSNLEHDLSNVEWHTKALSHKWGDFSRIVSDRLRLLALEITTKLYCLSHLQFKIDECTTLKDLKFWDSELVK
jgi:hypothetical protein